MNISFLCSFQQIKEKPLSESRKLQPPVRKQRFQHLLLLWFFKCLVSILLNTPIIYSSRLQFFDRAGLNESVESKPVPCIELQFSLRQVTFSFSQTLYYFNISSVSLRHSSFKGFAPCSWYNRCSVAMDLTFLYHSVEN